VRIAMTGAAEVFSGKDRIPSAISAKNDEAFRQKSVAILPIAPSKQRKTAAISRSCFSL